MDGDLRNMVMRFRVTELQALLGHAGKNKTGRKNELQSRALELVKSKSPQISMKIRELYRSIAITNYGTPLDVSLSTTSNSSLAMKASTGGSSSYGSSTFDSKVHQDPMSSFGRSVGYHRVIGGDGQYKSIPICPDIKMKELPFYDILAVLLRPTSLINQGQCPKQETQHSFCLSPSQAGEITNSREVVHSEGGYAVSKIQYLVQVQLRFCALDSTEEQDDLFPQGLVVKVNGRLVQLPTPIPSNRPGVEPKRPSKPLNITTNVKCCPLSNNTIHVSWIADQQKNFCMLINIVKKLTADQLFSRLKAKRIQPADFTRGRIKEITTAEEDDLCAPTSIRVSVACPLGKSRMAYPCRATTCKHLQCFDANLFLLMNERKPTFVCPVCNKHLKFNDLCIDGYFMDVIKNLSIDSGNEIELYPDGTWVPAIRIKSETENVEPPAKKLKASDSTSKLNSDGTSGVNETIDLDDDIIIEDDIKPSSSMASTSQQKPPAAEPECIDLSSDDDDDDNDNMQRSTQASTPQPRSVDTEVVHSEQSHQQDDDDDDEEEIGIRPRRRKTKVSYVEDSSSDSTSTNEGNATAAAPTNSHQPRSPACIELSDSPTPSPETQNNQQGRPFASLGSSHSSAPSSSANNNRSGSGSSSTMYSSSGIRTTTASTGGITSGANTTSALHHHYQPPFYSSTSTFSVSSSYSPSGQAGPLSASASSSSSFFPSNMSTPGYTAYDASTAGAMIRSSSVSSNAMAGGSSWDDDINSLINPQGLSYGSMDSISTATPSLSFYNDFLNAAAASDRSPFPVSSSPSLSSLYDPNSGAAGGMPGSGYARWM